MASNQAHWTEWSSLPDGPCELVADLLPRVSQLACRLVCRSWRLSFTHALTPLTLDTRVFAQPSPLLTSNPPSLSPTPPSAAPASPAHQPPLDPAWTSLTSNIGPTLPSLTLRVALYHESKARAAPCTAACVAALRALAHLPRYDQSRLQLQLPLRYALPEPITTALSGGLLRLRSLRLVRCSLTQQLAGVLGGMRCLRHLCVAHANLAALPQLLEAATHLEHVHVHGYHSLVIVEDNAHQHAVWNAAVALVTRGRSQQQQGACGGGSAGVSSEGGGGGGGRGDGSSIGSSSAAAAGCSSSAADGGGDLCTTAGRRLRCLAVSAHHLYHDTVLDETELDFESEALRWQIRYDSSYDTFPCATTTCTCGGASGVISGGAAVRSVPLPERSMAAGGGGGGDTNGGKLGSYDIGTGGCCHDPHEDPPPPPPSCSLRSLPPGGSAGGGSAASFGRPHACGGSGSGSYMCGGSGSAALCAAALVGLRCSCCCNMPGASAGAAAAAIVGAGGNSSTSGSRESVGGAAAATASGGGGGCSGDAGGLHRLQLLKSGKRDVCLHPGEQLSADVRQPHWRNLQYVQLNLMPSPAPPPLPPPSERLPVGAASSSGSSGAGVAIDSSGGAGVSIDSSGDGGGGSSTAPPPVSLAPLNELRDLTGVWLDPAEWDEVDEINANVVEEETGPAMAPDDGVQAAAAGCHWVRVGAVWTRLHTPPSAAAAHAPVQDAVAHAGLLAACSGLRSLALGDRRTPFLGVGDDTAALLARLAGLTKLHLSAAYTLPLGETPPPPPAASWDSERSGRQGGSDGGGSTAVQAAAAAEEEEDAAWLQPQPRLAPLGSLTALQRLGLHFSNPLGKPAVVSYDALPSSLTSLSLQGVVLLHQRQSMAAAAMAYHGGSRLRHLRDLCLTASYIERPDLLCCGARLRTLSLRDSGMGGVGPGFEASSGAATALHQLAGVVGPSVPGNARAGDAGSGGAIDDVGEGGLIRLLRMWHGLQTLRVTGCTATAGPATQLPPEGRCLNWHSAAGLQAITCCLPGLRMLQLAPPKTAVQPSVVQSRAVVQSVDWTAAAAAAAPVVDTFDAGDAAMCDAAAAVACSRVGSGGVGSSSTSSSDGSCSLPRWHLISLPFPAASNLHNDTPSTAAPLVTAAADQSLLNNPSPTATNSEDQDNPGDGSACPTEWLRLLLRLLCRHTPHLTLLRLSCTADNRDAAERAVQDALALLPSRLPYLEHLSIVLDLPLSYIMSQPQPEQYAREWAARLRTAEEELQAHMRYTCVSLSPHPNLASSTRGALRARAAQAGPGQPAPSR